MHCDQRTRAYLCRRQAEGRSTREIQRCLKRATARQLFRFLKATPASPARRVDNHRTISAQSWPLKSGNPAVIAVKVV
jgi:hypothetical protein